MTETELLYKQETGCSAKISIELMESIISNTHYFVRQNVVDNLEVINEHGDFEIYTPAYVRFLEEKYQNSIKK